MLNENPYRSPAKNEPTAQQSECDEPAWRRLARDSARGCMFGGVLGALGGVAILLFLRICIQPPVLMPGSTLRGRVIAAFMAFALVPSASVGAAAFAIRAVVARKRQARPPS